MPSDIRLRLAIRRHGVPEVKLVWPCIASEDFTISKLLTQVNEVITLESGEWGLEDYAVELADGGFECLHFQQVSAVFKNDDQVLIRSLLTEDLKRRLLSGRHQISADGKHLVDGLAFGRPWLRTPRDRPALTLPPRKRARLAYESDDLDDEEQEEEPPRRLLLEEALPSRIGRNNNLQLQSREFVGNAHDDDDEDQDYNPSGETYQQGIMLDEDDGEDLVDEENLDEEIRLLQADNDIVGDIPTIDVPEAPEEPPRSLIQDFIRAIEAPAQPIAMAALQAAFPLTPSKTLESHLKDHDMDIHAAYQALAASNDAALSYDEILDGCVTGRFEQSIRMGNQEVAEPAGPSRPLIEEVESNETPLDILAPSSNREEIESLASSDSTSSSGDSSSDSDAAVSAPDTRNGENDSSDDSSSSDSEEDEDEQVKDDDPKLPNGVHLSSSEDSSDSSSVSSAESRVIASSQRTQVVTKDAVSSSEDSSDSSSDSSSEDSSSDEDSSDDDSSSDDSDSDAEPEQLPSKPVASSTRPRIEVVESTNTKDLPPRPSEVQSAPSNPSTVGRGQGNIKTQKRNARRKLMKQIRAQGGNPQHHQQTAENGVDRELAARKQALLSVVAEDDNEPNERTVLESGAQDTPNTKDATGGGAAEQRQNETPTVESERSASGTNEGSEKRRMRVDMGAGRRLLFGALGVKAPKTKADAESLKKNLMKDVRPLKNHRQSEGDAPTPAQNPPATEADDSTEDWREKITYRAVECCYEGVVLSEPPFPFVQRWDPQQQYGSMRKRKRGSQNIYQDNSYYEDEDDTSSYPEPSGARFGSAQKRVRTGKQKDRLSATANDADDIELNYDDPVPEAEENSHADDAEDLPALPDDITSLPLVLVDKLEPGMVITWQQLNMSKATNWQPQLASVTATVLSVDEKHVLQLQLAKRDWDQDEKVYDEDTGQRVYDKFEMPEDSEEDDTGDDGRREVSWAELIEARLVRDAPTGASEATGEVDTKMDDAPTAEDGDQSSLPQSGQGKNHLDFSVPSIELPTNSEASRGGTSQSPSGDHRTNILTSHQPRSLLIEVVDSQAAEQGNGEAKGNASGTRESESSTEFPDGATSLEVISASPDAENGVKPGEGQPNGGTQESHHSIQSGRQPGTDIELAVQDDDEEEEDDDDEEEAVIPDTNQEEEGTPKPKMTSLPNSNSPEMQSSPNLPSVAEIWQTAATSRQARSPPKSSQLSVLREARRNGDDEYERAIQQAGGDDEVEEDIPRPKRSATRNLFPNATQPSPIVVVASSESDSEESRPRRSRRVGNSSPIGKPIQTSPDTDIVKKEQKAIFKGSPPLIDDGNTPKSKKGPGRPKKKEESSKGQGRRKSSTATSSLRSGKKYSPLTSNRSTSSTGRKGSRKF